MLDLEELGRKLDEALAKETKESLGAWLEMDRKRLEKEELKSKRKEGLDFLAQQAQELNMGY